MTTTRQPTKKQEQLAKNINRLVQTIEQEGGGDTEILVKAYRHMTESSELLYSTTEEQMDSLCETYHGFYRFEKLIQTIAQGLKDVISQE